MAYARTGFTIATNGQTLTIAITFAGVSATIYSDAALTSAVTLPQTITSDTTYYVHPNYLGRYTVSALQPDGTELWGGKVDCFAGDEFKTISPLPTAAQVALDTSSNLTDSNRYAGRRETVPRWAVQNTAGVNMTSQTLRLSYLTAPASETIGSLSVATGSTAAAATPSLCRLGLYSVASDGGLTLVASTTNDTALFSSTASVYTKAVSANYAVTAGARYAIGALVVTATTVPTLMNATLPDGLTRKAPRLCGAITSQADLPASLIDTDLNTAASGAMIWAAMVPA